MQWSEIRAYTGKKNFIKRKKFKQAALCQSPSVCEAMHGSCTYIVDNARLPS